MGDVDKSGSLYAIDNYIRITIPEITFEEFLKRFTDPRVTCAKLSGTKCNDFRAVKGGNEIILEDINLHQSDLIDFHISGSSITVPSSKFTSLANSQQLYFTFPSNLDVIVDPFVSFVVRRPHSPRKLSNGLTGPYNGISNTLTLDVKPVVIDIQQNGHSVIKGTNFRAFPGYCIDIIGEGFPPRMAITMNGANYGYNVTFISGTRVCVFFERFTALTATGEAKDEEEATIGVSKQEIASSVKDDYISEMLVRIDTFVMLIFGDSVTWNQGAEPYSKSYFLTHEHVQSLANSRIGVYYNVFAHSGAPLVNGLDTDGPLPKQKENGEYEDVSANSNYPDESYLGALNDPNGGEIPRDYPSVIQQLDMYKGDKSNVDLIFMGGCGNDIGVINIGTDSCSRIDIFAKIACRTRLKQAVRKAHTLFPKAAIFYHGYYYALAPLDDISIENIVSIEAILITLSSLITAVLPIVPTILVPLAGTAGLQKLDELARDAIHGVDQMNYEQGKAIQELRDQDKIDIFHIAPVEWTRGEFGAFGKGLRVWEIDIEPGPDLLKIDDQMKSFRKDKCEILGNDGKKCEYAAFLHPSKKGHNILGQKLIEAAKVIFNALPLKLGHICPVESANDVLTPIRSLGISSLNSKSPTIPTQTPIKAPTTKAPTRSPTRIQRVPTRNPTLNTSFFTPVPTRSNNSTFNPTNPPISTNCTCDVYVEGAKQDQSKYCSISVGTLTLCFPYQAPCQPRLGLPTLNCPDSEETKRPTATNTPTKNPSSHICNCALYLGGAAASPTSSFCTQPVGNAMLCYPDVIPCPLQNGLPTTRCTPTGT